MGNLNEACEQIAETSLELSNELRALRVDIFEKERNVSQSHLRRIKDIYRKTRARSDINIRKVSQENDRERPQITKAPCGGCKGK
jgi:Na+/phosphate symporter